MKLKYQKKKIQLLKKKFKEDNIWFNYKNVFEHKQMKFICSKIILLFSENKIEIENLFIIEKSFLQIKEKNIDFFQNKFDILKEIDIYKNIKWEDLQKYLFYVFQISTFYSDLKTHNKNIFNFNNSSDKNEEKRGYFYNWINSLVENKIQNFNLYIIKILKWLI